MQSKTAELVIAEGFISEEIAQQNPPAIIAKET